jgi:hypothetical protein
MLRGTSYLVFILVSFVFLLLICKLYCYDLPVLAKLLFLFMLIIQYVILLTLFDFCFELDLVIILFPLTSLLLVLYLFLVFILFVKWFFDKFK